MFASANDARTTLSCRKTKKKQNVKMWFSFRTKNSTVSSLHALVFLRGHTPSRNSPSSEATVSARSVTSSKPMTLEILCIRIWFLWQLSTRFTVLAYRYLHPQTCIYSWSVPTQDSYTPYLAEEFRQSSSDEARQRLYAPLRHHRLSSDAPVFQPSAIELFRNVAAARLWNTLPLSVTSASSLTVFGKRLKTHLFSHSFPESPVVPAQ